MMPNHPTELFRCMSIKPVSEKSLSKVTQLYISVEFVPEIFKYLTAVREMHYCFVSTPVKEPANTHPFSNTQSHHNSLWHTKMHTMILVHTHTHTHILSKQSSRCFFAALPSGFLQLFHNGEANYCRFGELVN